ncbi:hypothetical protein NKR23_g11771 [Pleurostoma richardsiae]|uniref:Uncharacterized protein n=1 Tax=Pleurostoma richardsiae TaxID=41990 RepID=A0AA38R9T0_9PEZI|nr:hypothetical protein NKR23_g11771 [Pleurostoma richardsiae]
MPTTSHDQDTDPQLEGRTVSFHQNSQERSTDGIKRRGKEIEEELEYIDQQISELEEEEIRQEYDAQDVEKELGRLNKLQEDSPKLGDLDDLVEKAEEKLDALETILGKIARKLVKLEERRNGLDGEFERLKNA